MADTLTAKTLREQRAPLTATIRKLADVANAENRDFTAEEKVQWDAVNKDYNDFSRRIDLLERADAVEADQKRVVTDPRDFRPVPAGRRPGAAGDGTVTDAHRALAFQSWCRAQLGLDLSEAQEEACSLVGLKPYRASLDIPLLSSSEYRRLQQRFKSVHPSRAADAVESTDFKLDFGAVLATTPGTSGGYLIPPENLIRQLEVNMLYFGPMAQVAEIIRTTSGEPMSWPTADDTMNTGVQLAESTTIGASVDPVFAKVTWNAWKFSSKPVLVPYELLEDSAFDLASLLGQMLGERLGRITNTKYTTGAGTTTPKGIVVAASAGPTSATATAITGDDLLGLIHSIDPAYRTSGCAFMMHDNILLAVRKLKDTTGQYLWQPGIQMGVPDRFASFPLYINNDMQSTIVTATKTVLFGQLSKYKIRKVNQIRMYRLEERYRDTDQDGFIAFTREDGNLLTAGTAPVKYLLQA